MYATRESPVTRVGPNERTLTIDVFMRDQHGSTGRGVNNNAIVRVRYRYRFLKSSVSVFMAVTTYAKVISGSGTPFVKEPKFAVMVQTRRSPPPTVADEPRSLGYHTISVHHLRGTGNPRAIREGDDIGTVGLVTDHSADPTRSRIRFDYTHCGREARRHAPTAELLQCCDASCSSQGESVLPIGKPGRWEGSGLGLDKSSVATSGLSKSYPRDTDGDDSVTRLWCTDVPCCGRRNHNGVLDPREYSEASEDANTNVDRHRRSGAISGFFLPASDRYAQAFAFFHGWENQAGPPTDCRAASATFGPQGGEHGEPMRPTRSAKVGKSDRR